MELWRNSVWGAIYSGFGVSKTFLCRTHDFETNHCNSLRHPLQSGSGSLSKIAGLDFNMLKQIKNGYGLLVSGYWLLAIGYWLLLIGNWLLIIAPIGYWLLALFAVPG